MAEIVEVDSLDSLREAVIGARERGLSVAIAGGRHGMGGQQFCEGGLLLDTHRLARILDFDRDRGLVERRARECRTRRPCVFTGLALRAPT
jgi:FAD/FMN-containing dehydrogenase